MRRFRTPASPSVGFFPAESYFSERLIPVLVDEGVDWTIVPDLHIARACEDYPYHANEDNCDPPNRAEQQNPAQGYYYAQYMNLMICPLFTLIFL